ncbi:MAG: hypothetical protein ABL985_18105 [Casimicrobium sp.]
MKVPAKISALLLSVLFFALPIRAADDLIKLSVKFEKNGAVVASPTIIATFGSPAAFEIANRFRLEVVTQDAGKGADMSFKVYTDEGDGMKARISPRIVTAFGELSTVSATNSDGSILGFSVVASRATK